eukprot:scaffold2912_cov129-Isochrysis_galbana.AAC.5
MSAALRAIPAHTHASVHTPEYLYEYKTEFNLQQSRIAHALLLRTCLRTPSRPVPAFCRPAQHLPPTDPRDCRSGSAGLQERARESEYAHVLEGERNAFKGNGTIHPPLDGGGNQAASPAVSVRPAPRND